MLDTALPCFLCETINVLYFTLLCLAEKLFLTLYAMAEMICPDYVVTLRLEDFETTTSVALNIYIYISP